MAQIQETDLSTFLDLDLDLGFPSMDQPHHQMQSAQNQMQVSADINDASNAVFDFSMPMHMSFNMSQPQQSQHMMQSAIPPTPNSVEMHADQAQYLQNFQAHERAIINQYMKRSEAHYTPMNSPVVHGVDNNQYHISNPYTVPGAYFSPLTSPALEGQQYYPQTSASSVATSSPVDLDVDMADLSNTQTHNNVRPRKRPISDKAIPRTQISPAVHPRRTRKSTLSRNDHDLTGTDSVSPEPLSDHSMRPPLHPASATHSPALRAAPGSRGTPATPASLMHLKNSPRGVLAMSPNLISIGPRDPMLPPLSLPEAAANLTMLIDPNLESMDSSVSTSRKTPKLGPLSTPSGSATPGPQSKAVSGGLSPLGGSFPNRRLEPKGRGGKKRGSISNNTLVSPAIRPKISPSIKPLLPEGGKFQCIEPFHIESNVIAASASDDTHAIFLASRSNYQNLIEGTHVPGVSYPSELSTNLTSKRTSHKIAEQGRRNRINLALQEMLQLLPKNQNGTPAMAPSALKADGEDDFKGGKGNGNSKAATVESAIEYIKVLQVERLQAGKEIDEKAREMEKMRARLAKLEKLAIEKGVEIPEDDTAMSKLEKKETTRKKTSKDKH
jgi:hypothetical protein